MIRHVNNSWKFKQKLDENKLNALNEAGKFCVGKMDHYVPVDTGYLRSRNEYKIASNELYLQNDCFYAKFQEFGTYKMKAQPFMRPAVFNHKNEIGMIMAKELGRDLK